MIISEQAVRNIKDHQSLLNFLQQELQWHLPENPTLDEATFEWSAEELQLSESMQNKLHDGSIFQIRPMKTEQPWGIFIINFKEQQVYKTALRQVLRGLVAKRRRAANLPMWCHENLLFICTSANQQFTFAHFRGEKAEDRKSVV